MKNMVFILVVLAVFAVSCGEEKVYRDVYKPEPVFVTEELPAGGKGISYTKEIQVVGGEKPYTFEISAGNLPAGVSFNDSGEFSGTPTATGTSNITIKVTDAKGNVVSKQFSLRIAAAEYNFAGKWGTDFESGIFLRPEHPVVDSSGNLYFSDELNRVLKFDSAKNFVLAFGKEGWRDGEFYYIRDVAIHDNVLYVVDSSTSRISSFDLNGNFIAAFETYSYANRPSAICFDSSNVYLLDAPYDSKSIVVLDHDFNEIDSFPVSDNVLDIDCDASGRIFCVGYEKDGSFDVNVYDATGVLANQWNLGSDNYYLTGIAVDQSNNLVYITDTNYQKVWVFTTDGAYAREFDSTDYIGDSSICLDSSGNVVVTAVYTDKVLWFSPMGAIIGELATDMTADDCLNMPQGIAVSDFATTMIEPEPQITDSLNSGDLKTYTVDSINYPILVSALSSDSVSLCISGNAPITLKEGEFTVIFNHIAVRVREIAGVEARIGIHKLYTFSGQAESVYVADSNNDRIMVYDLNGNLLSKSGQSGNSAGEFCQPRSIAVDNTFGRIFISDSGNRRIQIFGTDMTFISALYGSIEGPFDYQIKCKVDGLGNLYVLLDESSIAVFDLELRQIRTISAEEGYEQWVDFAVGKDNNIYIADRELGKVKVISSEGKVVRSWQLVEWPNAIALDKDGDIIIAERGGISKYNKFGDCLAAVRSYGSEDGEFRYPQAIAVDSSGNLYVADTENYRIQVLAPVQ